MDLSLETQKEPAAEADTAKLENLIRRRSVYGDITQNADPAELEELLKKFNNQVPKVIKV